MNTKTNTTNENTHGSSSINSHKQDSKHKGTQKLQLPSATRNLLHMRSPKLSKHSAISRGHHRICTPDPSL